MKILLCFGTRPEAIKMAPLYHELKNNSNFQVGLCVTAQHREMLDQVLDFFEINPDFDLNLMTYNQSLNGLCASILVEFDKVLETFSPDIVLVHGDTSTSSMAALASFHRAVKIGHVEAGLRTYNKNAPFPEEINRQLTARLADFHFAPTVAARQNLVNEGITNENILVTGNTIIDALLWTKNKLEKEENPNVFNGFDFLKDKKYILVTGHRRESFGQGMTNICEALLEIAQENDVEIVFPVHLNPSVQKAVHAILGNQKTIHLVEPVSYPVMVWLMSNCSLIISDSGGIQEEAPTFNKHVLVTREVSERKEGIAAGCSTLVGTNKELIKSRASFYLNNENKNQAITNPYGDGNASQKISEYLINSKT